MDGFHGEIELPATIEEVWSALTEPDRLSAWFGATAVEVELRPGGRITFGGLDEVWRGVVEAVDPPRLLSFRWLPAPDAAVGSRTRVEFRLEPRGAATRLFVREIPLWGTSGPTDLVETGATR
ncbi:MAG: SRPBCC domain-containing protein [Actinomycetota bacterium]